PSAPRHATTAANTSGASQKLSASTGCAAGRGAAPRSSNSGHQIAAAATVALAMLSHGSPRRLVLAERALSSIAANSNTGAHAPATTANASAPSPARNSIAAAAQETPAAMTCMHVTNSERANSAPAADAVATAIKASANQGNREVMAACSAALRQGAALRTAPKSALNPPRAPSAQPGASASARSRPTAPPAAAASAQSPTPVRQSQARAQRRLNPQRRQRWRHANACRDRESAASRAPR